MRWSWSCLLLTLLQLRLRLFVLLLSVLLLLLLLLVLVLGQILRVLANACEVGGCAEWRLWSPRRLSRAGWFCARAHARASIAGAARGEGGCGDARRWWRGMRAGADVRERRGREERGRLVGVRWGGGDVPCLLLSCLSHPFLMFGL